MRILTDLSAQGPNMFRAALVWALAVAFHLFYPDGEKTVRERLKGMLRHLPAVIFVYYAAFLLTSAVLARSSVRPTLYVTSRFGLIEEGRLNFDLVENVLIFIPYTFLFLSGFPVKKPVSAAFLTAFLTSAVIELSQLAGSLGEFQLADLLYNSLGGILGGMLWCGARRLRRFVWGRDS